MKCFPFLVGKNCGLVSKLDYRAGVIAGFSHRPDAEKFAKECHDGLNWVLIYDEDEKTIKSYSPTGKEKSC